VRQCIQRASIVGSLLFSLGFWFLYFSSKQFSHSPLLFGRFLYFSTLALFTLTAVKFFQCLREGDINFSWRKKPTVIGLISSLLITTIIFLACKPDYRLVQDEPTLTAISYMMAKEQAATIPELTRNINGDLTVLRQGVDKRPPLFPFYTHLFHHLLGYSPANPFIANAIVLFLFFFTVFSSLTSFGIYVGLIGQLLVAAQPAVYLGATSAGFDLFSSFILFLALLCLRQSLATGRERAWSLTCLVFACFCFVRYESVILAVIGLAGAAYSEKWLLKKLSIEAAWLAPLVVIFTPLVWLLISLKNPAFHELEKNTDVAFSFGYLFSHTAGFLRGLFFPKPEFPNLFILHALGLVSLFFLIGAFPKFSKTARCFSWITAAIIAAHFIITAAFFFGDYSRADAIRLFLNFLIPFSLLPAICIGVRRLQFQPVFLVAAIGIFMVSIFSRSPEVIFNDIGSTKAYLVAREFLADKNKQSTIVISRFPTSYAILGYGSIDFETLALNVQKLRTMPNIYVFQNIKVDSGQPRDDEKISTPLQTVKEVPISGRHHFRISRLKE
jgi:hypothetical protein